MRAAIFVGEGEPLSVEEVTPRPPGPKDVTVQVLASGVCHSDLSIVNGYVPLPPPSILGHEGAGVVLEVGADVARPARRPHHRLVHPRLRPVLLLSPRPGQPVRADVVVLRGAARPDRTAASSRP